MADLGWEDDDASWGGVVLTSKNFVPVYLDSNEFYAFGFNGALAIDSFVERRGAIYVPNKTLIAGRVELEITGPVGYAIQVKLGAHDAPDGAIDWEGPYDFIIGEDTPLDFAVSGKFIAFHLSSSGVPAWKLQAYHIEYGIVGNY